MMLEHLTPHHRPRVVRWRPKQRNRSNPPTPPRSLNASQYLQESILTRRHKPIHESRGMVQRCRISYADHVSMSNTASATVRTADPTRIYIVDRGSGSPQNSKTCRKSCQKPTQRQPAAINRLSILDHRRLSRCPRAWIFHPCRLPARCGRRRRACHRHPGESNEPPGWPARSHGCPQDLCGA